MKAELLVFIIPFSLIGVLVLFVIVVNIDDCCRRRRRCPLSMRSNAYDLATATRNHPEQPLPTSGQQTGGASDGWSETDANATALTQGGSLVLPPPVVMRDNSRSSLYEQSLSLASWSTPPPVYTRWNLENGRVPSQWCVAYGTGDWTKCLLSRNNLWKDTYLSQTRFPCPRTSGFGIWYDPWSYLLQVLPKQKGRPSQCGRKISSKRQCEGKLDDRGYGSW